VLSSTHIGKNIESLSGDISVEGESVIVGDIIYHKPESRWFDTDSMPTLSIASTVLLEGNIILERPVELNLENADHQQKVIVRYSSKQ
jgi:hypothetical protein